MRQEQSHRNFARRVCWIASHLRQILLRQIKFCIIILIKQTRTLLGLVVPVQAISTPGTQLAPELRWGLPLLYRSPTSWKCSWWRSWEGRISPWLASRRRLATLEIPSHQCLRTGTLAPVLEPKRWWSSWCCQCSRYTSLPANSSPRHMPLLPLFSVSYKYGRSFQVLRGEEESRSYLWGPISCRENNSEACP